MEYIRTMKKKHDVLLIFLLGTIFIIISIVLPFLLGLDHLALLDAVWMSRLTQLTNPLMLAMPMVVFIDTVLFLPLYIGAFFIGEGISRMLSARWLSAVIPALIILTINVVMEFYTAASYPLTVSKILLTVGVVILQLMDQAFLPLRSKVFQFVLYFLALNWLNMVTWLTPYGLGTESLEARLKNLAEVFSFDYGLNIFSIMISLFLLFYLAISIYLGRIKKQSELEKNQAEHVRLKMAEARSGQEVLFLVHDLKTPLTSIQGLVSLIELKVDDKEIRSYTEIIEQSISSMNEMISDILFEKMRRMVPVREILNTVESERLSGSHQKLHIRTSAQMPLLYINKTRIVRALINLINNAFEAVANKQEGAVHLLVAETKDEVHFSVIDNGIGIPQEHLDKIWSIGFSTKDSAGAGLAFVRQVIEAHHGRMEVRSKKGDFTAMKIILPKGEKRLDEDLDCG
ncbi:sensor histidine kinase [Brevibacillus fluminis]|uniref:histidine kinase n=2 Tax=Brevibacillus fluminis TaxID=511487 RepID=A0A3M8DKS0_9BACL|nr:sensor histidine kinase [Brevibacillus fluminis]